ncbi:MAG: 50S ribosomal protein L11 methyltransferase [Lachnospiraceae bacterium]|nr:50S ribosomal protein L11 methyltransferase [Lachnospiraceae bacterium]
MNWTKCSLTTTEIASDLVVDMLLGMGIDGVETVDKIPLTEADKKRMFIDILPELPEDDGLAELRFYIEPEKDVEELRMEILKNAEELKDFVDCGSLELKTESVRDEDWQDNWKQFFKTFRVDDNIVIHPSWTEDNISNENDLIIEIDPGTAFGTGSHETTRLCISNIRKYIKEGSTVLDLGTGSGILSIISKKLGASRVVGSDIDEIAVKVAYENAAKNGLEGMIEFLKADVLNPSEECPMPKEGYDLVVANILADVIIPLSGVVSKYMAKDGVFISSGIINIKAEEVKDALLKNGFEIVNEVWMNDWVSYAAVKK